MNTRNKSGMTLVEVVVSLAILSITIAVSLGGIALSLNMINRASEITNDYNSIISDMTDEIGEAVSPLEETEVTVTVDSKTYSTRLVRREFLSKDDNSPISGFYMYLLK